jgi:hypothetical protein
MAYFKHLRLGRWIGAVALGLASACAHSGASPRWPSAAMLNRIDEPRPIARVGKAFRAVRASVVVVQQTTTQDRSVAMSGALSSTVNEVVPIPGTDMIRTGSLQEGSLFQNNFRSPNQEANSRGGTAPTQATIVFRVFRP